MEKRQLKTFNILNENKIFGKAKMIFCIPTMPWLILLGLYLLYKIIKYTPLTELMVDGFNTSEELDEYILKISSIAEPFEYAVSTIFWIWLIVKITT